MVAGVAREENLRRRVGVRGLGLGLEENGGGYEAWGCRVEGWITGMELLKGWEVKERE